MARFLQQFISSDVGVDLGTSRTRIWTARDGVVLDEASCLAVDTRDQRVVAVGTEAAEMRGRVGSHIVVHFPIQQGTMYDDAITRAMLEMFFQRLFPMSLIFRPRVMVSVPAELSSAKIDATTQLFLDLGARDVSTISQPLAAAIGAGVPIADASGTLLMQLGSGVVEAALISLGSIVTSSTTFFAGLYIDQRIQEEVKKTHGVRISHHTAVTLKHSLASLVVVPDAERIVTGQSLSTFAPQEVTISATDLQPVMAEMAGWYEGLINRVLTSIPPELTSDVIDKGIVLSGGLSSIAGLEEWLRQTTGVAVTTADEPDLLVIRGIATALEHFDAFTHSLGYTS